MKKRVLFTKIKYITLILSVCFAAAFLVSCGGSEDIVPPDSYETLGDGVKSFYFTAYDNDKELCSYLIYTNRDILADALKDHELISGENDIYGLYVKTVCGVFHEYETDGMYWALKANGETAPTGVSQIEIEDGAIYSFISSK